MILENKTKDPIALPKSVLGYIDFPECNATQLQPQPYTVYNLNQVTQTLLYNIYPENVEVHKCYASINTQFDDSPFYELNQISINISSTVTTLIQLCERKYNTFLHKFNFQHS